MNKFAVLAGGFLLLSVALGHPSNKQGNGKGQEVIGPIEWECERNGVFPFPDACDQYVDCWDDNAFLWRCTDDMLFDITYNGCNHAQYTHCYDIPRPTNVPSTLNPPVSTTTSDPNITTTTTESPPIDYECTGDGVFPHEERCEYFWRCYAGQAELIHCPMDYLFDLVFLGCNFPELTDCGDRQRPPGASTTTKITTRPTSTTQAATTTTTEAYTGPTTTIDPNATTIATTTQVVITTTGGGDFQCPPGVEGDFADPKDCSAFYTCLIDGTAYHNHCPDGLYFDQARDLCDYPVNVDCGDRPIPTI